MKSSSAYFIYIHLVYTHFVYTQFVYTHFVYTQFVYTHFAFPKCVSIYFSECYLCGAVATVMVGIVDDTELTGCYAVDWLVGMNGACAVGVGGDGGR